MLTVYARVKWFSTESTNRVSDFVSTKCHRTRHCPRGKRTILTNKIWEESVFQAIFRIKAHTYVENA